jgi:ribosomal protein S12 methylthiotransferase
MAEGALLPYLDVPLQHASPTVLRAMRRPGGAESHLRTIQGWRAVCPDLVLRSTFIVGFPGETEADVDLLVDFLREAKLDRVGAFTYSEVPGATANDLPGAVPEEVKRARYARVMEAQQAVSMVLQAAKVGRTVQVIVDDVGELPGAMIGRTHADAPDVDGRVLLETDGTVAIGDVVEARITAADAYDLHAVATRVLPWRPNVPTWGTAPAHAGR